MRGEAAAERVSLRVGISEVLILNFLSSFQMRANRKRSGYPFTRLYNVFVVSGTY